MSLSHDPVSRYPNLAGRAFRVIIIPLSTPLNNTLDTESHGVPSDQRLLKWLAVTLGQRMAQ